MSRYQEHRPESLSERLHALFAAATAHASEAMSRWTGGQVSLALGSVEEVAPEEAVNRLDLRDELLTFVTVAITGAEAGRLMLAFDDENVDRLAFSLLGDRACGNASEALRNSALCETANILGSSYLATLSDTTDALLLPSPPTLVRDYGACVLELAVMEHMLISDRLLLLPIDFANSAASLRWQMFFVPAPGLMGLIRESLAAQCAVAASPDQP